MKKKLLIILWLILNVAVILFLGIDILLSQQEDTIIDEVALYNWQGEVQSPGYFDASFPISKYWFLGEAEALEPGVYNVAVHYNTNKPDFYLYCDSDVDGKVYPTIYAEDYLLDVNDTRLDFTIWVNDKIDVLKIVIECGKIEEMPSDRYLEIDKIEVDRSYKASVSYRILVMLMKLASVDLLVAVWLKRDFIKKNFFVVLGLSIVFFVSSISVFTHAQGIGHDLVFHWGRIIGLQEGIRAGQIPVKIQPGWVNDYGFAASVFYGDVLLYIPAILYALKLPIVYVYKFYVLLINLGTVLISYYCYKKISGDRYIAVGCTALYCLSVNRILNVLLRAAVGEYSAYMFFPLLVLGMWNLLTKEENEAEYKKCWIPLVWGMTGVIQTHTLSFEMVSIFLVIVCVIMVKRVLCKKSILLLLKSVMWTILLNVWFFVPFIDYASEELKVFAEKTDGYGIQHYGISLYELFSIGTVGTGSAVEATQGLVGRYPISLGVPVLITILLVIILVVKYPNWEMKKKRQFLIVTGITIIPIWFSTYYFPWNRLAGMPLLNSVISSIQFPWRFLSVAMPMIVLVACLMMMQLSISGDYKLMKGMLLLIMVLSVWNGLQYTDMIVKNNRNYVKYDGSHLLDSNATISGAEYLYDETDINRALAESDAKGERVYVRCMERNYNQLTVECVADAGGYLEVPLFAYPYYECEDEQTGQMYQIIRGDNNRIHVGFANDYEGTLRIAFKEPWHWRLAELVSLICWICFSGCIVKKRRPDAV